MNRHDTTTYAKARVVKPRHRGTKTVSTRTFALVTIVLVGWLSITIRAQQAPVDPVAAILAQKPSVAALTIEKRRDNFFVIRGGGGNIAAFITRDGVVMVDAGLPGWGQVILDKLKTVTDGPVRTLMFDELK